MKSFKINLHKVFILLLSLFILLSFTGCKEYKTDVYDITGEPIALIKIDISEITNDGLKVNFINDSNNDICQLTGECFIQKNEEGNWKYVTNTNNLFTKLLIDSTMIDKNSNTVLSINWLNEYGSLEAGQYRLVISCKIADNEKHIVKAFTIE